MCAGSDAEDRTLRTKTLLLFFLLSSFFPPPPQSIPTPSPLFGSDNFNPATLDRDNKRKFPSVIPPFSQAFPPPPSVFCSVFFFFFFGDQLVFSFGVLFWIEKPEVSPSPCPCSPLLSLFANILVPQIATITYDIGHCFIAPTVIPPFLLLRREVFLLSLLSPP